MGNQVDMRDFHQESHAQRGGRPGPAAQGGHARVCLGLTVPTGLGQAADELADSFFFFFATEAHPRVSKLCQGWE